MRRKILTFFFLLSTLAASFGQVEQPLWTLERAPGPDYMPITDSNGFQLYKTISDWFSEDAKVVLDSFYLNQSGDIQIYNLGDTTLQVIAGEDTLTTSFPEQVEIYNQGDTVLQFILGNDTTFINFPESITDTLLISQTDTLVISQFDTLVISETDTLVISETDTLVISQLDTLVISQLDTLLISQNDTISINSVVDTSLLQDAADTSIDTLIVVVTDSTGNPDTLTLVDTTGNLWYSGENGIYVNGDKIGLSGFLSRSTSFLVDKQRNKNLWFLNLQQFWVEGIEIKSHASKSNWTHGTAWATMNAGNNPLVQSVVRVDSTGEVTIRARDSVLLKSPQVQYTGYPASRNDTSSFQPINFLYTDSQGRQLSAPIGIVADQIEPQKLAVADTTGGGYVRLTGAVDSNLFRITGNLVELVDQEFRINGDCAFEGDVWFVSEIGDNSAGIKGKRCYPLADPWAAIDSAVAGDMIVVFEGVYQNFSNPISLWKPGVTMFFDHALVESHYNAMPDSGPSETDVVQGVIFHATTPGEMKVFGTGRFFSPYNQFDAVFVSESEGVSFYMQADEVGGIVCLFSGAQNNEIYIRSENCGIRYYQSCNVDAPTAADSLINNDVFLSVGNMLDVLCPPAVIRSDGLNRDNRLSIYYDNIDVSTTSGINFNPERGFVNFSSAGTPMQGQQILVDIKKGAFNLPANDAVSLYGLNNLVDHQNVYYDFNCGNCFVQGGVNLFGPPDDTGGANRFDNINGRITGSWTFARDDAGALAMIADDHPKFSSTPGTNLTLDGKFVSLDGPLVYFEETDFPFRMAGQFTTLADTAAVIIRSAPAGRETYTNALFESAGSTDIEIGPTANQYGLTINQDRIWLITNSASPGLFEVNGDTLLSQEADPLFFAAPAAGITAQDITDWDEAHSWGDHATQGYLTTFSEIDPVYSAAPAAGITAQDIIEWDEAHSWGNHATQGYLTTFSETDPVYSAAPAAGISGANITNWNTAFGWGDHATQGYLTSYSETDPVYSGDPAFGISAGDITNWNTAFSWGDHATQGYLTSAVNSIIATGPGQWPGQAMSEITGSNSTGGMDGNVVARVGYGLELWGNTATDEFGYQADTTALATRAYVDNNSGPSNYLEGVRVFSPSSWPGGMTEVNSNYTLSAEGADEADFYVGYGLKLFASPAGSSPAERLGYEADTTALATRAYVDAQSGGSSTIQLDSSAGVFTGRITAWGDSIFVIQKYYLFGADSLTLTTGQDTFFSVDLPNHDQLLDWHFTCQVYDGGQNYPPNSFLQGQSSMADYYSLLVANISFSAQLSFVTALPYNPDTGSPEPALVMTNSFDSAGLFHVKNLVIYCEYTKP